MQIITISATEIDAKFVSYVCVCVSNAATKSRGREREGDNAAYGDKRCRCHRLCIICTIVAKKMRAAQLQIQDAKVTQLQIQIQIHTHKSECVCVSRRGGAGASESSCRWR